MRLLRGSLLVLGWVLSCGDSGDDVDRGTAPQIWCRGVCAAALRCGSTAADCETECVATRPGLSKFSEDGARAMRPCLAALTCAALQNETLWSDSLDACWRTARTTVDISGHARSFCTAYTEAWFECAAYWSVTECERTFSMWSDAVIDRFEPCLEESSCYLLRYCDEATWNTL
jgi:hypothetical protein